MPRSMAKPEIAFDLDGVLCRPPLGVNVAISRVLHDHPLPEKYRLHTDEARKHGLLRIGFETLKYLGRRPMPDALEGLQAISEYRTPVIVTARHAGGTPRIRRWLEKYDLARYINQIYANNTSLSPAEHKLRTARERGITEHVDDDGSVAYYLAKHGLPRVYLRGWFLNRGLPYPPSVHRIRRLIDIAEDLRQVDAGANAQRMVDTW